MENGLPLCAGGCILARHPAGILALEKPEGVATHPNSFASVHLNSASAGDTALLAAPYSLDEECYILSAGTAGTVKKLYLLNRLDSPTSGIVLAAETAELATVIKQLFSEHAGIRKTYYAIVAGGRLPVPAGIWRDKLLTRRDAGTVRTSVNPRGIPAFTRYEFIASAGAPSINAAGSAGAPVTLSLLRLTPETGRAHQLRVHCAAHHRPIAGDKTYGDFALNRRIRAPRLFLHAAEITIVFNYRGKRCEFTAVSPPPAAFTALFPCLETLPAIKSAPRKKI